jgi:hypothetical protein
VKRNFRLLLLFGLQGGKSRVLEIFRRWANCWCWVPVPVQVQGVGRRGGLLVWVGRMVVFGSWKKGAQR